jgi:DHA3 family macrolide efflux protein-like MFS transporter
LNGILLTDIATFLIAIGALLVVYVPPPVRTMEGQAGKGNLLREAAFGFRYIFQRPSLLGLVVLLFFANLFLGFPNSVTVPMVLSRTGNNSLVLGVVQTVGAASWVVGSLLMSVWGGFKRRIHGVLLGWSLYCVFGAILFGLGRGLTIWVPALVGAGIMATVGNTSSQALLQAKVAPDVQGRVFSARRMISWAPDALTPVLGGALADLVMEPAMRPEGVLAGALGWLAGTGPGAGMSLLMIFFGLCTMLTMLSGYLIRRVRNIEAILPDHDQLPSVES